MISTLKSPLLDTVKSISSSKICMNLLKSINIASHSEDFNIPQNANTSTLDSSLNTPFVQQSYPSSYDKLKLNFAYSKYAHHEKCSATLRNKAAKAFGTIPEITSTGDDALFVSDNLMGIADGVTGWSAVENGNASLWARSFLQRSFQYISDDLDKSNLDYLAMSIDLAYKDVRQFMDANDIQGSSTLLLASIAENRLHVASIGDSRIWIIRDGQIILANDEHLDVDGCPRQVGTNTNTNIQPSMLSEFKSFELKPNDLIVMSSDGLADNLWPDEIVKSALTGLEKFGNLQGVADRLLYDAQDTAFDNYAVTPYSERANALPFNKSSLITGGKVDDVSICVAKVEPAQY